MTLPRVLPVLAVASALLLSGCGGSDDDPGPVSTPGPRSTATADAGTAEDYVAARTEVGQVERAFDALVDGFGVFDKAVKANRGASNRAFQAQLDAFGKEVDDLAQVRAMQVSDVRPRYEAFVTAAADYEDYVQGYIDDAPVFERYGDTASCNTFRSGAPQTVIARYRANITQCKPDLDRLAASKNGTFAAYGTAILAYRSAHFKDYVRAVAAYRRGGMAAYVAAFRTFTRLDVDATIAKQNAARDAAYPQAELTALGAIIAVRSGGIGTVTASPDPLATVPPETTPPATTTAPAP